MLRARRRDRRIGERCRLAVEDPAVPARMTSLSALLSEAFRAEALK